MAVGSGGGLLEATDAPKMTDGDRNRQSEAKAFIIGFSINCEIWVPAPQLIGFPYHPRSSANSAYMIVCLAGAKAARRAINISGAQWCPISGNWNIWSHWPTR
jgi:hypothetical protein